MYTFHCGSKSMQQYTNEKHGRHTMTDESYNNNNNNNNATGRSHATTTMNTSSNRPLDGFGITSFDNTQCQSMFQYNEDFECIDRRIRTTF